MKYSALLFRASFDSFLLDSERDGDPIDTARSTDAAKCGHTRSVAHFRGAYHWRALQTNEALPGSGGSSGDAAEFR